MYLAGSAEIVEFFDVFDAPRGLHRVAVKHHVHRTFNKKVACSADDDHTDPDIKDEKVFPVG